MLEFSSELIAALAGALAGSAGGVIAYWWRNRRERQQSLNLCLFTLMDIWHRIEVLSTAEVQPMLILLEQKATALGVSEEDINRVLADLKPQLHDAFEATLKGLVGIRFELIRDRYVDAVGLLAKEEPILAYALSGHEEFPERLTAIGVYFERFRPELESSNEADIAQRFVENKVTALLQEQIEKDLYEVAWQAGLVRWANVRLGVRRRKVHFRKEWQARGAALLDEYFASSLRGVADPVVSSAKSDRS